MCLAPLNPVDLDERTFDARQTFKDVFVLLLEARQVFEGLAPSTIHTASSTVTSSLMESVHKYRKELYALPQNEQYSRHIIGKHGSWMGYICRWEAHVRSSIHSHPSFAYYQVLEGEFKMDLYDPVGNCQARHSRTLNMYAGDHACEHRSRGHYDNLIHKISTRDTPGFTLHLFSENPATGRHYETVD